MWKKLLAVVVLVVALSLLTVQYVKAATSVDISVKATPAPLGSALPPINFTAVYVGEYHVDLTWDNLPNTENTMIRVKYGEGPTDRNDGYLVYYGDSENTTDLNVSFDNIMAIVTYRAWSENTTGGWSVNYAEASVGGDLVEAIADAIVGISGTMISIIIFLVALIFTCLAYKVMNSYFCRIMSGMLWITAGIVWIINDPTAWSFLIIGVR